MKKKLIFCILAAMLLAGTALTFAHNTATTTATVAAAMAGDPATTEGVVDTVSPTDVKLKYSTGTGPTYVPVSPSWTPVKDTTGGIAAPGDIFYLDSHTYTGDIVATLYLTNASELSKDYSYLNMLVNVWEGSTASWTGIANVVDGSAASEYLTPNNGYITFILHAATHYDFSIDSVSYHCIDDTVNATNNLSPQFYLDVRPF